MPEHNVSFDNLRLRDREVAEKFRVAHERLVAVGALAAAGRLAAIDAQAGRVPFEGLERLVDPDRAIWEVAASIRRPRKWRTGGFFGTVRFARLIRNITALLPVLFTLVTLAIAVRLYGDEQQAQPRLAAQPFLLLWQRGFGNGFLSVTWVAVIDAVFLVAVVVSTVWVDLAERLAERRQAEIAGLLYNAMSSLESSDAFAVIRPPASAEDWAHAASRIIAGAMEETRSLSQASEHAIRAVTEQSTDIQEQARQFATTFATVVSETLASVQEQNAQYFVRLSQHNQEILHVLSRDNQEALGVIVDRLSRDNQEILRVLAHDNQEALVVIVKLMMAPLVEQLRAAVDDFSGSQADYRAGVAEFTGSIASMRDSAQELATSVQAYRTITASATNNLDDSWSTSEDEAASTLPVSIYISNAEIHDQVEAAIDELLATAGLQVENRDEPITGSWFRQMQASVKEAARSPAAREAALIAAHAADTRLTLAQDASVTATLMQNLGPVIASLQPTKDAVCRVGALLIVKIDWVVSVFQLTAAQQAVLDHQQPKLALSPQGIIAALNLLAPGQSSNGVFEPREAIVSTEVPLNAEEI
jgi:hypothetical protein